ncbi:hypothetical protein SANTM175S_04503 [Streptomyces antimycoticus]
MLGSTYGTLTTNSRHARAVACGRAPGPAVHVSSRETADGTAEGAGDVDVSGRPLHCAVPDLDRFFHPESVALIGASDADGRPNTGITRQLLAWAERVGARLHPVHPLPSRRLRHSVRTVRGRAARIRRPRRPPRP